MKLLVIGVAVLIFGMWLGLAGVLLGHVSIPGMALQLPTSTAALGDSAGVLNGIFSSVAVVLALAAVLLQGKELKDSTAAQNAQAESLAEQLKNQESITQTIVNQLEQQRVSNQILLLQTQQQYHASEIERMDSILLRIEGTTRSDNLFQNCVDKKKRHKKKLDEIQNEMDAIESLGK